MQQIKIVNNEKYIKVSKTEAIKKQAQGVKLYQIDNLKSLYIKTEV